MDFYSNLTNFYQTNPNFRGKLRNCVGDMTIIPCVYSYRLLLCYSKVNISSYVIFMKPVMGIIVGFLCTQTLPFYTKQVQTLEENRVVVGLCWQKDMYVLVQTGVMLLKSQYSFIRKVREAWDENHSHFSTPTSPFYTKQVPIFRITKYMTGCFGQKDIYVWLQTGVILLQSQDYFIRKVHEAWNVNHRWIYTPTSLISTKRFLISEKM